MAKLQTFSGTQSLPSFQQYKTELKKNFLSSLHYETRERYLLKDKKENEKTQYVNYLESFNWNYFVTGTTRYTLTIPSARRLSERWFEKISSAGDTMFWVCEPFELKDGQHIHALLKTDTNFSSLVDLWQWATGNKANGVSCTGKIDWEKPTWNAIRLENYNKRIGAGGYVMKYVLKKRCDYDLLFQK